MPYSHLELAEVFIKTGELHDALEALNQLIFDQPDDSNARRLRASVLLRLGTPEHLQMALNDLNKVHETTIDDYVQQSIIFERLQQPDNAIKAMQIAHQAASQDERILERLIDLLIEAKQYDKVLEILEEAPQTWRWLMREAEVHRLSNYPTLALDALNRAETHLLEIFPDLLSPVSRNTMAQIHIARGQIQMKLNNLKAAEVDFRDALYHIPDDATIQFNLGLIYALKNNLTRAEKYCQKALNNASDYVRQSLVTVLGDDDRYTELKARLDL